MQSQRSRTGSSYRWLDDVQLPVYGGELLDLRNAKKCPAGRIVVVGTMELAATIRGLGKFVLVTPVVRRYEWKMIYGLPVIFALPDIEGAARIAFQIADAAPSAFSIVYPDCPKEVVIWR